MKETLMNIFNSLILQDYLIIGFAVFFGSLFSYLGLEKLHKSYLGTILGLFLFSFSNLILFSLNTTEVGLSSFREFVVNHRNTLALLTIFLIPLLAILIPLNTAIFFRLRERRKSINYIISFLLGFLYIPFFITIFLSITNNRFLFSIDPTLLQNINENFIIKSFLEFIGHGTIFDFLKKYDYLFNSIIIFYIFYKMTIGGIIDFIIMKLVGLLNKMVNKSGGGGGHGHGDSHGGHDDHHDDHGHGDSHGGGHDDHGHGHDSHHH